MPPRRAARQLTEAEKQLVRSWIEEGAHWSGHWAFEPIRPPALPIVKSTGWVRNEIDAFDLEAMEQRGIGPSEEAHPRTLIRRLSLDITGLPPARDEAAAFLADHSPDSYS